jgi:hypothetical protein
MEKPRVSVAMVVCNVERFLAEAIESILDQTLDDFEFIIVDFGSTDGTPAITSRYQANDRRIKTYVVPHCRLAEARNASCSLAQSPYIAIMDADDVALKDRLKRQVEFMDKHAEVGILGGAVELIDDAGKTLRTWNFPSQNGQIKDALLANQFCFAHPSIVMRKDVFASVGGYRGAFLAAEDYDLWLRMAERCELANLEAPVLKYRMHATQESVRRMQQQTLSALAAQASAAARRKGLPDPMNAVNEITPAVVAGLGVPEAAVENTLLMKFQDRVILAVRSNFDVPIIESVSQMLAKLAESKHVQDSVAAAVWLAAARAYMSRRQHMKALAAATRALLIHPALAGDVARRGLRRMLRRDL